MEGGVQELDEEEEYDEEDISGRRRNPFIAAQREFAKRRRESDGKD